MAKLYKEKYMHKEQIMAKEVFLIVNDSYTGVATDVVEFNSLEETNLQLGIISFGNLDDDILILHGVFAPATFIPENFKGCTPYIFIRNPAGKNNKIAATEAHFEKSKCDPDVVALTIEELLKEKSYNFDNMNIEVTIDDVQLFFGHELEKILCVPDDHVDEELIERVSKFADTIVKQDQNFKRESYNVQKS